MAGFAGLAGFYGKDPPGYFGGLEGAHKEQDYQNQQIGSGITAQALQLLMQGGPSGMAPMPPPQGQASMPQGGPPQMRPPMAQGPPQGPMVNPQNPDFDPRNQLPPIPMAGGGPPAPPAGPGVSTPQTPSPGAPGPPRPPQMPSPQGGGFAGGGPQGPQGPALDLQSVIRAVTQAGRGAPPQAIVQSINQFIPLMNLQSQQQWREMSLQIREQLARQQMDIAGMRAGTAERGATLGPRYDGRDVRGLGTRGNGAPLSDPTLTLPNSSVLARCN